MNQLGRLANPIPLFRSKYETYRNCPRQRFLAYELQMLDGEGKPHPVKGIKGNGISIFLAVGSAIHEGLKALFHNQGPEEMLKKAKESFREEVGKGILLLEPTDPNFEATPENIQHELNSCNAIIEGLLWGFYLKVYPELLETYEILESEQDKEVHLEINGQKFKWLVKLDLLMRRKEDNELVVMSFKSLSTWGQRAAQSYQISAQNFSEPWAFDKKLEEWWNWIQSNRTGDTESTNPLGIPDWFFRNGYDQYEEAPKIHSVMMGVFLKGYRKKDEKKGLGWRNYYSPLVGGWKIDTGLGMSQYAWTYKRAKGWEKFKVWEEFEGGAREWVELLATGTIEPEAGDALLSQYFFPEPLPNRESFAQRWVRQMVYAEGEISAQANLANQLIQIGDYNVLDYLDKTFPMNTKNCYQWGGLCPMREICWERPEAVVEHLLLRERFSPREPHHELEEGEDE